jgi:Schlafen, AlbA_2
MSNSYTDQELAAQLQLDLAEGESWHIEFKKYDHTQLGIPKTADSWKDDLSDELAALASIGGKIYIGIGDDGTIKGIGGTHQAWQEKLFERAAGRIKPKVNWKSHYFTDPTTGLTLIRLDVLEGEPIYYVMGKPYIREGTKSRPAEPEEVKARLKDYFTNREPILPTAVERANSGNDERTAVVSWVTTVLMNVLSSLNLYEEKQVDPELSGLKRELERSRKTIEDNINKVKRTLGETSNYYQELEVIASEILAATKVEFYADGGKSWAEWLGHLKKIQDTSSDLLESIRSSVPIVVKDLNEQVEDARDKTLRWLNSIDEFRLSKFTYEASRYVQMLLRLHYLLWLSKDEQKASQYKEIADEIERLSWARDNVDYQEILRAIPELQQKLGSLQ